MCENRIGHQILPCTNNSKLLHIDAHNIIKYTKQITVESISQFRFKQMYTDEIKTKQKIILDDGKSRGTQQHDE